MLVFLMAGRHHRSLSSSSLFKYFPRKISNSVFSPELPDWFRFAEGEQSRDSDSEDDFLLPATPEASEVRPASGKAIDVRMPFDQAESSDIARISKALNARFRCPEEVVLALSNHSPKVSKDLVDRILKRFSNDWIPALGFFRWAGACAGFDHSPDSFDTMVDILGRTKQFDTMWSLVEEMGRLGGLVSISTMTRVIRRLAGAARWRDAIRAFHDVEKFGISRDTTAMNILLDSLCKERSVMRARDAFLDLRRDIPPNASSYNILIHGWCGARKLEEARQTLEEMKEAGFKPCVITYTSLVEAYCAELDFRKVEGVLDEMNGRGISPDVMTFNTLISAACSHSQEEDALKFLAKMGESSCRPNLKTYVPLLKLSCSRRWLRLLVYLVGHMFRRDVSLDLGTYTLLVRGLCRTGKVRQACVFYEEMVLKGFAPKSHSSAMLLEVLGRKDMDSAKSRVQELMMKAQNMRRQTQSDHALSILIEYCHRPSFCCRFILDLLPITTICKALK